MTIVTSNPVRLDMQNWGYLGVSFDQLRQVNALPERGEIGFQSTFDPNALVSVPPINTYATQLRLTGAGFGDFDANGVPHSGTVRAAQLANNFGFVVYFDRLNMPVAQFIELVATRDGALLRGALLGGDDVIDGGYRAGGIFGELGDLLLGGAGNDTISGHGGHDTLDGGAGDDFMRAAGGPLASSSQVEGGDGFDTVTYDQAQGAIVADLAAGIVGQDTLSGIEQLIGSSFADRLAGSAAADALAGGDGADTINGAGGADTIIGAAGQSYLRGDEGADWIMGGADFDDINGNMGNDTAYGGLGADWVVGGKDADQLFGEAGDDIVYGNMGNDTCSGGEGADLVRGGQDSDVVLGEEGNDWLSGDRGDDTVTGGAGADVFHTFGDAGIDRVTDFNLAEGDRVMLDPGTTYSLAQVGADTVITLGGGGGQMMLVGVQMSSLSGNWIFGA